jgi:hypothetical protein
MRVFALHPRTEYFLAALFPTPKPEEPKTKRRAHLSRGAEAREKVKSRFGDGDLVLG